MIAHEVGHHIQNELGILGQVAEAKRGLGQAEANVLQVRLELMADCLAGIWARHAGDRFGVLERGDLEEALNAAARIGDDTLQREAGRVVRPDSFTHGSSAQAPALVRHGLRHRLDRGLRHLRRAVPLASLAKAPAPLHECGPARETPQGGTS